MRSIRSCVYAFIGIVLLISCTGRKNSRIDLMTDLEKTDSVELIYFRTPDSVRYFTYLPLKDKDFIASLVQEMKQDTVPEITCLKEGKIYLFKNGEIFNTVFFGYMDKDCTFLRYIKNGRLYHYPMSQAFKAQLIQKKRLAKEPVQSGKAGEKADPAQPGAGI